jgi:hypothetical protein
MLPFSLIQPQSPFIQSCSEQSFFQSSYFSVELKFYFIIRFKEFLYSLKLSILFSSSPRLAFQISVDKFFSRFFFSLEAAFFAARGCSCRQKIEGGLEGRQGRNNLQ